MPSVSEYRTLADFGGKRIGVVTGAIQGPTIEKEIPSAEVLYYNSIPDLVTALDLGKIDGLSVTEHIVRYLMTENENLTFLDEPLTETMKTGFIFPKTEKGAALRTEFNEYLADARESGLLDEIEENWLGKGGSGKTSPDIDSLSGEKGTLVLGTDSSVVPYSFVKDNVNVGMDIDIVLGFCEANGYALKIEDMNFGALVDAVSAEKCDFAAGAIAYTKERAESADFSDPIFTTYSVIGYPKTVYSGGTASAAVKGEAVDGVGESYLSIITESFNKTFIRENRWQLFWAGIGTTLLIAMMSILFGTVLGFLVFMLCRNGNRAASAITGFFVWLVQGMPVVVLLMILYYIIFGNVSISGTAVSIICFTLIFGAGFYSALKSGVSAIDKGQLEAAYALGYTNRQAFFRIILPQAMPLFMPAYKNSITELIKGTAIVGYVAVQDLTKIGDIVRSRTYEAFFPLIAIAVIYFILAAILIFIVKRIEFRIDPRQRPLEKIKRKVEGK